MKRKLIYCLAAVLMLAACTGQKSKPRPADAAKPVITVTLEPQRFFTEAIAGDRFEVKSMVPKGSSPETYDPVPQQLVALSESQAYLRIGYIGFELNWMDKLTANNRSLRVFDTSQGISLIRDEGHRHGTGHSLHEGVEPHIWSSPANALQIARNTCEALCRLDSAHAAQYRANAEHLAERIQRTDSLIRLELARPGCARAFMIYHPALSYFARDYDLRQISIEEGGKEPSPAHLKALMDRCKSEGVRVIFVQPEFDRRNAETIARQTGTTVVPINPLSYDWEGEMLNVARALAGH